jgi:hypothetical protein
MPFKNIFCGWLVRLFKIKKCMTKNFLVYLDVRKKLNIVKSNIINDGEPHGGQVRHELPKV